MIPIQRIGWDRSSIYHLKNLSLVKWPLLFIAVQNINEGTLALGRSCYARRVCLDWLNISSAKSAYCGFRLNKFSTIGAFLRCA